MAALARFPCPKQLLPQLRPISCRIGPQTIMPGPQGCVVAKVPWRLYAVSRTPRTAATTTGKCAGRQLAIAALAAMLCNVGTTRRGDIGGNGSLSPRHIPTKAATLSSVGTMSGNPSPNPAPAHTVPFVKIEFADFDGFGIGRLGHSEPARTSTVKPNAGIIAGACRDRRQQDFRCLRVNGSDSICRSPLSVRGPARNLSGSPSKLDRYRRRSLRKASAGCLRS